MANVNFWTMPLTGRKTQVLRGSISDATCSITNACPVGSVAIYCNDAIYTGKGLIKNIGQSAIDVLRDGLIDHSELYSGLADTSGYLSGTKLNNPRPIVKLTGYASPNATLIITADPLYQVGIIVNQVTNHQVGLAFTALERLRDYINEKNGV